MSVAIPSALLVFAGVALAKSADSWGEGFDHTIQGRGYGMFGRLMMLQFWWAIIALIVFAVRDFSAKSGSGSTSDAAEILREHYTQGKIDVEENERARRNSDCDTEQGVPMPTEL